MTRYRELTRLLMLTVWPLTRSGCYLSLIAFTICRDYGTSIAMGLTEVVGGENFEGEGMFHTALTAH